MNSYWDFVRGEIQKTGRQAPSSGVLWHYTSGEGLIGIIESGKFWTTQVACVNDSSELRYSSDLLLDQVRGKRLAAAMTSTELDVLFERMFRGLSADVVPTSEWFIGSLSEEGDDLSQWRAYGGGEGGYAIGFDVAALHLALAQADIWLAVICYDRQTHLNIAHSVVDATIRFYLQGLAARPGVRAEVWVDTFLTAWSNVITYLAPMVKHPAFASEKEWRVIRRLTSADLPSVKIQQRHGMLRRHLPLALRTVHAPNHLPIRAVRVGPARHKEVSRVSVATLLQTQKYPEQVYNNVLVSDVPFQAF